MNRLNPEILDQELRGLTFATEHLKIFDSTLQSLLDTSWSLNLPVFLFDRCWFRLEKLRLEQLAKRLPPDKSSEAPELIKYHQLLEKGHDHLLAMQECWSEFGIEDFHRAIRHYWMWQDKGNNGWTFQRYLKLIGQYKKSFEQSSASIISIPLIILARQKSSYNHTIAWIIRTKAKNSQNIFSISSQVQF